MNRYTEILKKDVISGKFIWLFKVQPGYVSNSSGVPLACSKDDSMKVSVGGLSKDRTLSHQT